MLINKPRLPRHNPGIGHDPLREPQGQLLGQCPTENGFNSVKHERVFGEHFATRAGMTTMAFEDIEVFDNRKRLHSTLGDTSLIQFLKDWISTQQGEKRVA